MNLVPVVYYFVVQLLSELIAKMKRGKAAGLDDYCL